MGLGSMHFLRLAMSFLLHELDSVSFGCSPAGRQFQQCQACAATSMIGAKQSATGGVQVDLHRRRFVPRDREARCSYRHRTCNRRVLDSLRLPFALTVTLAVSVSLPSQVASPTHSSLTSATPLLWTVICVPASDTWPVGGGGGGVVPPAAVGGCWEIGAAAVATRPGVRPMPTPPALLAWTSQEIRWPSSAAGTAYVVERALLQDLTVGSCRGTYRCMSDSRSRYPVRNSSHHR